MAITDTMAQLFASVQTEILIFLFAVIAHALFFGKYRLGGNEKIQKDVGSPKAAKNKSRESTAERSPKAVAAATPVVKALRPLMRDGVAAEAFAAEIEVHLQGLEDSGIIEMLTGLLECVGRSVTVELLSAVRSVLRDRSVPPNQVIVSWMLRGYLSLQKSTEFGAVLAEVEAEHKALSPNVSMLALRGAVLWSDLDGALRRIQDLAAVWKTTAPSSPSAAPQQTLAQVGRLACEKGQLLELLGNLKDSGIIAGWTLEPVLVEAAQSGNKAIVEEAKELARESKVELTAASYCALLRSSADAADAASVFGEAAAKGIISKDLLLVAGESALASIDAKLAAAVLESLMPSPATEVAAVALRLCAPQGPLAGEDSDESVLRLYNERLDGSDVLADTRAASLVAEAALRKGKQEVIVKLVTQTAEDAQQGPRRVALLRSFSAEHRLTGAHAVFKACEEKTACLFNAFIDMCIASKDLQAAEKVMAKATAQGFADVVTYNTIIKAHLHSGDARRARSCMDTMRSAGIQPNCITYNELMDAMIRKDPHGAWSLVEEMRSLGLQPNHVTCSILLKSIQPNSRSSEVERVLGVLDNMEDDMDEVLLSSVCEACIRVGRGDLLQKQLKRQQGAGGVQVQGAHTYGSIIRACGYIEDLAGVWRAWREMKRRHVMPTSITIGCMVEALVSNGEVEAGYELIREVMSDPDLRNLVNAVIYCSVLKGFSHQKRFDRVWTVYEEMLAEKMQFSIVTYNTLIDACARSCEMFRIPPLLEDMAKQQIEPNVITYSTVLKGYCQEHRLDKAFEVLEDMKKSKEFMPDEVTYNTLLDGCARYGHFDRGMSVLNDMVESGVSPSNFTLSVLVKLANRSHQPDKAFELCKDLSKKYQLRLNAHVYSNLVHACTAHGELRRAMEVLERMLSEHVKPDARTYANLMRACLSAGAVHDCVGLLRGALGLNGTHPRLAPFNSNAVQPRGGLPGDLVSDILENIAGACGDDPMFVQLLRDVRRIPNLKVDPKLSARLTSQAIHTPHNRRY